MSNNKVEYLISHLKYIFFEGNELYINEKKIDDKIESSIKEYAQNEMRDFYKSYLSNHFENLVILTGAGTSIGVGNNEKKGKTRIELWQNVKEKISEEGLKKMCEKVLYKYPKDNANGDLEALLSKAYRAKEFVTGNVIDGKSITNLIDQIEEQIRDDCSLVLPDNNPHELFLKKVTARKLKYPRIKIFTLNYDTLFEQAGIKSGFTILDGFSFSFPRKFSGRYFDYDIVVREKSRVQNEDNYSKNVFHLYKIHGSLDWEKDKDEILKKENPKKPVIIYPRDSKYESSYEQPFFEMMSRLQHCLRQDNVLLICIGFSFQDKHISTILEEAVEINPSFRLMIVTKGILRNENLIKLKEKAKSQNNIILIEETFDEFSRNYPYPKAYGNDFIAVKINKKELENED